MATCIENFFKHLELVIRQLEELGGAKDSTDEEQDKAYKLLFRIEDLFDNVFYAWWRALEAVV